MEPPKVLTVTKTVIKKQYPPKEWLKDFPDIPLKGETFKDAIAQSVEREMVIQACNIDKWSLREWVNREESKDDAGRF
ncbi:hypothetical protein PXH59_00525 (plasmid) [Xenorhabdus sp. SF857]|uniref:Rz1-like lysis system protein LysC n=1 Tax=Xenorhabdus bakwenae TaxID=3026967 RepID=UPI002557FF81|nr:hypothetical protein [Xenorhabdus sp. SF857]WFQ78163.1 hypothetical protein PXH59_00525 [Xenorhabdus sp. SF857]